MGTRLYRSIDEPIRQRLSSKERWEGPDRGLICCWERGRQKRAVEPQLAARADNGELVILAWKGGVEEKVAAESKQGTLQYLATWLGLRGEDLYIDIAAVRAITCSKTNQTVVFSARLPVEDE